MRLCLRISEKILRFHTQKYQSTNYRCKFHTHNLSKNKIECKKINFFSVIAHFYTYYLKNPQKILNFYTQNIPTRKNRCNVQIPIKILRTL